MDNGTDMHGMMLEMAPRSSGMQPPYRRKMMMHMTFFWGNHAEILFTGWPGTDSGMYALSLVFVFALTFLLECLSHCNLTRNGSNWVGSGLIQTMIHGVRVGVAYMVMLAVMSFNVGVFMVAIGGHAVGFLVFGSGVFKKSQENLDLSSMAC